MKQHFKERWEARKKLGLMSPGLWLALGFSFMLMLFAPMEIYLNNQSEFWYDAGFLFPWCCLYFVLAFVFFALASEILWLCGDRVYDCGLTVGFILFVSSYIQGNYLVKALPALDGSDFIVADYGREIIVSCVAWVAVAVIVVSLRLKIKYLKFCSLVRMASIFIFLMLTVTIVTVFLTSEGYQKKDSLTCIKDDQFEMSTDTNFVIFLLDAVDAGRFEEVMEYHPEYRESMKDFTYYSNVMGGYPCTDCAVPLLLSGKWYENKEPFDDYVQHVYGESAIFDELEAEGYGMSIYETELQLSERVIGDRYQNMVHTDLKLYEPVLFAKRQMKMVGFKYVPWLLKKYCYFDAHQLWNQRIVDVDHEIFMWEDSIFYEDLKEKPMTFTQEKQFKMIHLEGAHAPFKYNAAAEVVYDTDYASCIEASFTVFMAYLDKLRENGVYDNTVILVMADHGLNEDARVMTGRQNPILMIKGLGETHEFQISDAPISHVDFPGAYTRLLQGYASDAVFDWKEGDQRERRYLLYNVLTMEHMEEYVQTGHASDQSTLKRTGAVYDLVLE